MAKYTYKPVFSNGRWDVLIEDDLGNEPPHPRPPPQ